MFRNKNIHNISLIFRMESILIKMLRKIRDDSSRIDDGTDGMKLFEQFPAKEAIEKMLDIDQLEELPDLSGILDEMRRWVILDAA